LVIACVLFSVLLNSHCPDSLFQLSSVLLYRQTSDQFAYDGSSTLPVKEQDDLDILFSPAEHTDSMKKRKDRKRLKKKTLGTSSSSSFPAPPPPAPTTAATTTAPAAAAAAVPEPRQMASPSSAAAAARPPKSQNVELQEEEDVWYAKWWMFCFPDAKNMSPKR
jgi:hypothetical protein